MESPTTLDRTIGNLPELVEQLPQAEKDLFHRVFHASITVGDLIAPESMYAWIEKYFGSVEVVEHQKIVKLLNKVTFEGSLFNELRARRPIETKISSDLEAEIRKTLGDPFCRPETGTPSDTFGRVKGRHSITASNIAKYDGWHGLVIFDEHDPLAINEERSDDYVETGFKWAEEARKTDPEAKYFFFMWNCLWKGGASIPHGHLQVTLSHDRHYAKVEALRQLSLQYNQQYRSNYFDDLFRIHESLGLGFEVEGVKIISYLTPIKEKEILLWAPKWNGDLKKMMYRGLECFLKRLGVVSFNSCIYMPPLGPVEEEWGHFPVMVRMVDRGDPMNRTSDFGAMELYASSVIASDPFSVADTVREYLSGDGGRSQE